MIITDSSSTVSTTIRQERDLLALSATSSLKSTPSEPCKTVTLSNSQDESVQIETTDSRKDNDAVSVRDICRALSKKLTSTQQEKQKSRFECLIDRVKYLEGEYQLQDYCTYDKIVDSNIFSKRLPVSNLLIEEVTFKDFAKIYISAKQQQLSARLLEKEELERRLSLKFNATFSNFRPTKQSLEIQKPSSDNEIVLGGNYHDYIYCCEFKLPKMQTKSFILLEGNSVDSTYKYKQFLHVFRVYGEDLFSRETFTLSRSLSDVTIQFQ